MAAKPIWDFLNHTHPLEPSDLILVLGSQDIAVPLYSIHLFQDCYAPGILFTGGVGKYSFPIFGKTEGEYCKELSLANGIPENNIFVETKSTNTKENFIFCAKILTRQKVSSVLCLDKPYKLRRSYLYACHYYPKLNWKMLSYETDMVKYFAHCANPTLNYQLMLEECNKIKIYGLANELKKTEIPEGLIDLAEELRQSL